MILLVLSRKQARECVRMHLHAACASRPHPTQFPSDRINRRTILLSPPRRGGIRRALPKSTSLVAGAGVAPAGSLVYGGPTRDREAAMGSPHVEPQPSERPRLGPQRRYATRVHQVCHGGQDMYELKPLAVRQHSQVIVRRILHNEDGWRMAPLAVIAYVGGAVGSMLTHMLASHRGQVRLRRTSRSRTQSP